MAKLDFAPAAHSDLIDILEFISKDKPGAAANWIDKIESKCRVIAANPTIGEARPDLGNGIKSSFVGRYVIFFRRTVHGTEIVRVIAGDRDIRSLK